MALYSFDFLAWLLNFCRHALLVVLIYISEYYGVCYAVIIYVFREFSAFLTIIFLFVIVIKLFDEFLTDMDLFIWVKEFET